MVAQVTYPWQDLNDIDGDGDENEIIQTPVLGATVLVLEVDGGVGLPVAIGLTDEDGMFRVTLPSNYESDGTPHDIKLKIYLANSAFLCLDLDKQPVVYETYEAESHGTYFMGQFSFERLVEQPAARSLDILSRAYLRMEALTQSNGVVGSGFRPWRVKVQHEGSSSNYKPGNLFSDRRINLSIFDLNIPDVFVHEFGHTVTDWLDAYESGTCGPSHSYVDTINETCAWSEGFADFIVGPLLDQSTVRGWDLECENDAGSDISVYPTSVTQTCEGNVAMALYDLFDNDIGNESCAVAGFDSFSGGLLPIMVAVLRIPQVLLPLENKTFEVFWRAWGQVPIDHHLATLAVRSSQIDVNTAPVWNAPIPNQAVCSGELRQISLAPYATDLESFDTSLIFTVTSNSDPNVLTTINGDLLEVQIPTVSSPGFVDIEIEVSDQLLTASSNVVRFNWSGAQDQLAVNNLLNSGVNSVFGTVEIDGALESCVSHLNVEWGMGTNPSEWFTEGVSVAYSSGGMNGVLADWNTGVVESGTYKLRVTAEFGVGQMDQEEFELSVQHRIATVSQTGGDFTTVQAALNWAEPGDTVFVSGTFSEQLTIANNIVLQGINNATVTSTANSPLISVVDVPHTVSLRDITLEHSGSVTQGRGILCTNTNLELLGVTFRGHVASGFAAGVDIDNDAAVGLTSVRDCVFENNGSESASVAVSALRFSGSDAASLLIENTEFRSNATSNVYGSTVLVEGDGATSPQVSVVDCLFTGNKGGAAGVAVHILNDAQVDILNCLFANNTSYEYATQGIVVDWSATSQTTLEECTFVGNTHVNGSEIVWVTEGVASVSKCVANNNDGPIASVGTQVLDCIVFGNDPASPASDAYWVSNGTNVISEDPLFCDAANGDYTVSAISPAASIVTFGGVIGSEPVGCSPSIISAWTPTTLGALSPDTVIVGCPCRGDGGSYGGEGEIVVLQQSASSLGREVPAAELSMSFSMSLVGQDPGDGFIALTPSGLIQGNQDMSAATSWTSNLATLGLGGIGELTINGTANGYPVGQPYVVELRSPDSNGDGQVNVTDFSRFGQAYPPNSYNKWYDFDGDGQVNLVDNSIFGEQYGCVAQGTEVRQPQSIPIDVVLDYLEVVLSPTARELRVTVRLENATPFTTMCFALLNENPQLTFSSWGKDQSLDGLALASSVTRSEQSEIFMGIIPSTTSSSMTIGTAVFDVVGLDPIALAPGDFGLTIGEVLTEGNERRRLAQVNVNNARPIARQLTNALSQNYPNPFNPKTTIVFSLREQGQVSLNIYDVKGRLVRTLVDRKLDANLHRVEWDGLGNNGSPISSGIYFYRIKAGDFTQTKKMLLLK